MLTIKDHDIAGSSQKKGHTASHRPSSGRLGLRKLVSIPDNAICNGSEPAKRSCAAPLHYRLRSEPFVRPVDAIPASATHDTELLPSLRDQGASHPGRPSPRHRPDGALSTKGTSRTVHLDRVVPTTRCAPTRHLAGFPRHRPGSGPSCPSAPRPSHALGGLRRQGVTVWVATEPTAAGDSALTHGATGA